MVFPLRPGSWGWLPTLLAPVRIERPVVLGRGVEQPVVLGREFDRPDQRIVGHHVGRGQFREVVLVYLLAECVGRSDFGAALAVARRFECGDPLCEVRDGQRSVGSSQDGEDPASPLAGEQVGDCVVWQSTRGIVGGRVRALVP